MNDPVVESIVNKVSGTSFENLSNEVMLGAKIRIADSVACAMGSLGSDAIRVAWAGADPSENNAAQIFGRKELASLESATFCNTSMIRFLDFNDSHNGAGSGHPSDVLGAAFAAGSYARSSGKEFIAAVVGAYDCIFDLFNQSRIGRVGWDQGTVIGPSAAALAGVLLGLTRDQIGEAVAMSAVSGVAAAQTRKGQLSMWKGFATAHAAKMGVATVILAKAGATGPPLPFVGAKGLGELVFGGEIHPVKEEGAIARSNLKWTPCCFHAQGVVELASSASQSVELSKVESIDVYSYEKGVSDLGREKEKWRPTARETADHSMPFMVAVTLMDGNVTEESFSEERWLDPKTIEVMDKIRVTEESALTDAFPDTVPSRLEIRYEHGEQVFVQSVTYPKGHNKRPITLEEAREKFIFLSGPVIGEDKADAWYQRLMRLEEEDDIRELMQPSLASQHE